MSSSFRPSPSSSASSPLSYLIARPPPPAIPPLLMGPVYGANGVPTGIGAADAAPRQGRHPPAPLPRPSPRQCPRCGSANTKFCYYNNYSRAQPRYLCKACRRHWTEGGALRDVPVGGGRKNRRSGKNSSAAAAASASSNSAAAAAPASSSSDVFPEILTQVLLQPAMSAGGGGGYNIDLSAWQQVLAAPRGGDAGAAGGTAMEANCTGAGVPYWSGWLQDESMSGLDGAC